MHAERATAETIRRKRRNKVFFMDITFLFIVSMGVLLKIPKSLLMNQQGFESYHTPYPMPDHPACHTVPSLSEP
jgi:hypothetical protein